jgi:Zn-dependent protease
MPGIGQGSIRLFRLAGVEVFLHWSWFLVAVAEIESTKGRYSSLVWNILEYLALFLIVLMHEFGHALACRQVGGTANRIVLWPLGGVAYVSPPQRPGAVLWSIAAGPLVNVALTPFSIGLYVLADVRGWAQTMPDLHQFIIGVSVINVILLAFNLMPVYPLDGGKILRALLWFFLGRGRSLAAATVIGFIGIVGVLVLAAWLRSVWMFIVAGYMLFSCWKGLKAALIYMRQEKLPRRAQYCCPNCAEAPPIGDQWICSKCRRHFDAFAGETACSGCGDIIEPVACVYCHQPFSMSRWGANKQSPADFGQTVNTPL